MGSVANSVGMEHLVSELDDAIKALDHNTNPQGVCPHHEPLARGQLIMMKLKRAELGSGTPCKVSRLKIGKVEISGPVAVLVYRAAVICGALYGLTLLHIFLKTGKLPTWLVSSNP